MSTLLILLPASPPQASGTQDYEFWFSPDAQAPARAGGHGERASLSAMPKADRVIALIADAAVSWHTVRLPLALRGMKLRSALSGVLEEQLLDDPERLHLALMDFGTPTWRSSGTVGSTIATDSIPPSEDPSNQETRLADGEHLPRWVAAVAREPLRAHLDAIQAEGLLLEALLPLSWPSPTPGGHVDQDSNGEPRLRAWSFSGVSTFPMQSSGIRTWLGESWWTQAKVTASPVVSAEAERWLGRPVEVMNDTERAWAASQQAAVNLLQFDLTPRQRGWQRAYRAWQVLQAPEWRPFRWGVVALVVVQIIGLNAMAWQQRRAVDNRHAEQEQLLRQSFPQIRTVRDAPAQMQRETETARARAGQVGPGDLEDLLAAVARAMPPGQPPLQGLRYESNRLLLTGLPPPVRDQLRDRLGQNPALRVSDEGDALQLSLRPTTR